VLQPLHAPFARFHLLSLSRDLRFVHFGHSFCTAALVKIVYKVKPVHQSKVKVQCQRLSQVVLPVNQVPLCGRQLPGWLIWLHRAVG
jgi:hypothetical protein